MPSKSEALEIARYEAEDDLRTLSRAEDIRRNQKRLTAARRVARKQVTSLRRIAGPGKKR